MATVGVDFGTLASKIGVARHRGIDVITNEVYNRATPSLVAFGPKQRTIGEAGKTKNTIGSLKQLGSRSLNDFDVQNIEKKLINVALVDVQSTVGVEVSHAMYLSALGYGITKPDLPEADKPKNIAFVDVGHSSMSVSILTVLVKSTAYDRNLGGRDIDIALPPSAAEKLKNVLSANAEAPINVESIMNDVDASSKLTRDELEGLIADELSHITAPIERAIADSGLTPDEIELIGGSSRMPAVRARIAAYFPGKTLSTTLNQEKVVACSATFFCAMLSPVLSPVFRVRDFAISDISHYPIKVQWAPTPTDPKEDIELVILSFYHKEPFDIEAVYAQPEGLPESIPPWIAMFTAKEIPQVGVEAPGDLIQVRFKTRLNANGVMSFEGAYAETREEKEVPLVPAPMEGVEDAAADGATPRPLKKKVIKHDVEFVASNSALDKSIIEMLKEQENSMWENDKLVTDTEDRKHALEEYIYDIRSKKPPSVPEDWLYTDQGEDATKYAYVTRIDACKALDDPITFRWRESNAPSPPSARRDFLADHGMLRLEFRLTRLAVASK
ncbi:Hsp70 protein-domain-containing protein [Rhodocollybia butyracea]|uniref:Hsp70 protein-domain-containing protein n=1 Tax=Rhodocollybia butyracea TaxID=206335 RepID=A0A9P5TVF5_9AGAR|nr:Hsp70 protein-domain-containing protein [Rhodocollybia butyracea]